MGSVCPIEKWFEQALRTVRVLEKFSSSFFFLRTYELAERLRSRSSLSGHRRAIELTLGECRDSASGREEPVCVFSLSFSLSHLVLLLVHSYGLTEGITTWPTQTSATKLSHSEERSVSERQSTATRRG